MLSDNQQNPPSASPRASLEWRWVAVLLLSILLHLVALEWATGVIDIPHSHSEPADIVAIVQLPTPTPPAPQVAKPIPRQMSKPRPHHVTKRTQPSEPVTPPASEATTALTPNPQPDNKESTAAANALPESTPIAPAEQAKADTPPENPGLPRYKVDLPPSVELKYDVKRMSSDGSPVSGSGAISWENAGGSYQINGRASKLLIPIFHFKSEGVVDEFGIAPIIYTQEAMFRSATNTHFNRDERNSISFSSSKVTLPRRGGEQDRASVIWELAGIGRGDQEKFVPDAHIDFFVAGDHSGEIWQIRVIGQEEIETGFGTTVTWHVVRTPLPASHDDKIDIWLAPKYEWSPVQILYTYNNGGYLYMSMSSFHQLQFASARAETAR